MRAKCDKILVPIADMLIDTEQRKHITFDAFFGNTMFHEVAHGLGIKNTIDDNGTVRAALKEQASYLEEGKADILGLYMITALTERGELDATALADNYITFMTSIFRSIRFGASSAHGIANAVRFNFFEEHGAFVRDQASGRYTVNMDRMGEAMTALSEKILRLQGDGDYAGTVEFRARYGSITVQLQADLDRLGNAGVPVDVVFEQGVAVLGL
jgi:predicted Zn-dependent protease with MMP-like domain